MDEGVLRREPSFRAAREWCINHSGAFVLGRHHYSNGGYEYRIGFRGEDHVDSYFIEPADTAGEQGWDPKQTPLYPFDDDPHKQVDRGTKE
jgi:hypothetical protein